mmetsp:Transcript_95500/g.294609  ORF Transcript_95500/g.294609 Transcript_95500/m.294609 type:complete len:285 (-) Transcript_95500:2929-3783(-)
MLRERLMMPWHVCEQSLQTPQSPKRQSKSGSHESALQTAVSLESPLRGSPHSLAMWATCRMRMVVPPPQEAEQGDQADQSAHRPSSHAGLSQGSMLQARTSALSWTSHIAPPCVGILTMCLLRLCCPPLHSAEHPLQASHSPHWQSSCGQATTSHLPTSERWRLHPAPSMSRDWSTARLRCRCPVPQLAVHIDHSCQSETWQSWVLQGTALHPAVCMSSFGQALPPELGKSMIWRCLRIWPPPHVLSQLSQCVQSETSQSTSPTSRHDCVSSRSPSHGAPAPRA